MSSTSFSLGLASVTSRRWDGLVLMRVARIAFVGVVVVIRGARGFIGHLLLQLSVALAFAGGVASLGREFRRRLSRSRIHDFGGISFEADAVSVGGWQRCGRLLFAFLRHDLFSVIASGISPSFDRRSPHDGRHRRDDGKDVETINNPFRLVFFLVGAVLERLMLMRLIRLQRTVLTVQIV